jgi:hypothetical protein
MIHVNNQQFALKLQRRSLIGEILLAVLMKQTILARTIMAVLRFSSDIARQLEDRESERETVNERE